MIQINATCLSGGSAAMLIDLPDRCPLCHHAIEAISVGHALYVVSTEQLPRPSGLQVILRCPRIQCHRLFIAYYNPAGQGNNGGQYGYWELGGIAPESYNAREFETEISSVSSSFVSIYNQAEEGESRGLDQLCGAGYRKALEFLIKDFLKSLHRGDEAMCDKIESTQLAACIANYVKDAKLKLTACRATWLGNDETHYVRKWVDKDIADLKKVIDLTVHWVSAEILTKQLEASMPDSKPTAEKTVEIG